MIPYYKLFVIGVRTFTKPAIQKLKEKCLSYPQSIPNRILVKAGKKYYLLERSIQRKFLGVKDENGYEIRISDEKSLEKSATFIFEVIILYGILILVSLHELNRYTVKQKKLKRTIKDIKEENQNLKGNLGQARTEMEELKILIQSQQKVLESLINFKKEV
jgi:hypothetical protein